MTTMFPTRGGPESHSFRMNLDGMSTRPVASIDCLFFVGCWPHSQPRDHAAAHAADNADHARATQQSRTPDYTARETCSRDKYVISPGDRKM
jgi:hypothetical protein